MKLINLFIVTGLILTYLYGDHREYFPRDLYHLELSKKQKKEFKHLFKKYHHFRRHIEEKEEELDEKVQEEFVKDEFDKSYYEKERLKLFQETVKMEGEIFEEIHKILTPEQRKIFKDDLGEWEIE